MTVFALDSAGKTAGVAILRDDTLLYESYLSTGHTHSETLLPLCRAALEATGLCAADVDVFAANAGPGSFTGLRIGLAAVKGLAFVHDTPCAGVSTLEALARTVCCDGLAACALDARRGEVYCALFRIAGGTAERLTPDAAMPAADFAALVGQYGSTAVCLGDGAHLVAAADPAHLCLYPAAYRLGRAHGVCLAARQMALAGALIPPALLVPDYHRLSQAERERAQREQSKEGLA